MTTFEKTFKKGVIIDKKKRKKERSYNTQRVL